ncbi:hypothetical protein GGX14DRAFT_667727 [Mycena pura]|uniref:Uncharacterized protein n=1 Tax=Mycena pura TaxID=153505 RepID=A0AAD6V1S8_9AGAR|nr:hypothetical protein GGX14DRAFT_667727 [Mycena pura]
MHADYLRRHDSDSDKEKPPTKRVRAQSAHSSTTFESDGEGNGQMVSDIATTVADGNNDLIKNTDKPANSDVSQNANSKGLKKPIKFRLGTPTATDPASLTALSPLSLIDNTADLHRFVGTPAYNRIINYELAIGVDFSLENLATADSSSYFIPEPSGDSDKTRFVQRNGGKQPIRFFIIGGVTHSSHLRTGLFYGRRSISVMPSTYSWGRATGVIDGIFQVPHLAVYAFQGGISFSTATQKAVNGPFPTSSSPKKHSASSPSKKSSRILSSSSPGDKIQWDNWGVRSPEQPVTIYDARSVEFDIKNFRQLPEAKDELQAGCIVMVIFTLSKYNSNDGGVNLSFNIQDVVLLHDPVTDDETPDEVESAAMAKDPLPVISVSDEVDEE